MDRPSPLIVVTGTGTDVGKTHVSVALLRAWSARSRVVGYKPIETGIDASGVGHDARKLAEASTFHVKRRSTEYRFIEPISPHLAARREGVILDFAAIAAEIDALRAEAEGVLVELAGGAFSPLSATEVNLDLAKRLRATVLLLVAPDRIGVLHDVGATVRAAAALGMSFDGLALSAPSVPDASTGTNAAELIDITSLCLVASFPRAPSDAPSSIAAARAALERMRIVSANLG